eukprot:761351-Hanusia_phi.AAC.4
MRSSGEVFYLKENRRSRSIAAAVGIFLVLLEESLCSSSLPPLAPLRLKGGGRSYENAGPVVKSVVEKFRSVHGEDPKFVSVAPGRVNLVISIGEHTDYSQGFVMPCAIDFHVAGEERMQKEGTGILIDNGHKIGGGKFVFSGNVPLVTPTAPSLPFPAPFCSPSSLPDLLKASYMLGRFPCSR